MLIMHLICTVSIYIYPSFAFHCSYCVCVESTTELGESAVVIKKKVKKAGVDIKGANADGSIGTLCISIHLF